MLDGSLQVKVMIMAVRALTGGFEVRADREKKELIFVRDDGETVMTFDQIADTIEEMFKDEQS